MLHGVADALQPSPWQRGMVVDAHCENHVPKRDRVALRMPFAIKAMPNACFRLENSVFAGN